MAYSITDFSATQILVDNSGVLLYYIDKSNLRVSYVEPICTLNWHLYELGYTTKKLDIDFNDVTTPVVASAAALTAAIQAMIDGAGGSGTVTSVGTGTGLTGGPITTSGTVSLNTKLAPADSLTGNSLKVLRVNLGETAVEYATPAVGTVTSVSGTTNRVTSTGGATPVIDISATFEALLGKVASPLSQFASTSSLQLRGVLSDENGTGVALFDSCTSPTFITPILGTPTSGTLTNCAGLPMAGVVDLATAWTDYTGTSTVVGWSSFTTKQIWYKIIGKTMIIRYHLAGTSDSTTTTFTFPATSISDSSQFVVTSAVDSGAAAVAGLTRVDPATSVVILRRTVNGATYTASGTKVAIGTITLEIQ